MRRSDRWAPLAFLPAAVLIGSLEGAEVRVLAHLVRCRASGFMVLLPALEEVLAILEQLVDGDGDSWWFKRK